MVDIDTGVALDGTRGDADAHEIIAQAVARKGGLESLRAVQTVRTRTTTAGGPTEITISFPGRLLIRYDALDAPARAVVYDVTTDAASMLQGDRVRTLTDRQRQGLAMTLLVEPIRLLLAASTPEAKLEYVGGADVGERKAAAIHVSVPGGPSARVYIDAETHDLVALEYSVAGDRVTVVESRFEPVGGLMIAHQTQVFDGAMVSTSAVETVTLNPELAPDTFQL